MDQACAQHHPVSLSSMSSLSSLRGWTREAAVQLFMRWSRVRVRKQKAARLAHQAVRHTYAHIRRHSPSTRVYAINTPADVRAFDKDPCCGISAAAVDAAVAQRQRLERASTAELGTETLSLFHALLSSSCEWHHLPMLCSAGERAAAASTACQQ